MMYCNKCGTEIEEKEKFCSNCGAKIKEKKSKAPQHNSNNKKKKFIVICSLLIAIALIVGILLYINYQNRKNNKTISDNTSNESLSDIKEDISIYEWESFGASELELETLNGAEINEKDEIIYLKDVAKPGDYIKYELEEKKFTITSSESGCDKNQEFNTSDYNGTWQFLYNDYNYGMQIVSTSSVGELCLYGTKGYNNAVYILNSFSENYMNSKYAISARSIGSNPANPNDEAEIVMDFDNKMYNDKWKNGDKNYIIDRKALYNAKIGSRSRGAYIEMIKSNKIEDIRNSELSNEKDSCWLASRLLYYNNDSWGPSCEIASDCGLLYYNFYQDPENDWSVDFYKTLVTYDYDTNTTMGNYIKSDGVRPAIKLKTDLIVKSGDGTIDNPYKVEI